MASLEYYKLTALWISSLCSGPSGTLESLHRASIEAMLAGDHQFEHCWMKKEMENTRLQFLELLRPITDAGELEEIKHHVERDLGSLFTDAFKVRARFVPPTRCRYQIMQFKPGDFFDPDYMEIDAATAKDNATVPSSSSQKIKFCIHGCLLEHSSSVTEDSGTEVPHSLSRPFIQNDEHISPTGKGILKGDKAIVILEH